MVVHRWWLNAADVLIMLDFLASATAEYPDPPNFCHLRKSARKIMVAVNAAKFVKFGKPQQKLWLTFGEFTILPSLELYTLLTDYKR